MLVLQARPSTSSTSESDSHNRSGSETLGLQATNLVSSLHKMWPTLWTLGTYKKRAAIMDPILLLL